MAQELQNVEVIKITSPALNVLDTTPNDNLIDLYSVGHKEVTRSMCDIGIEVPFQHTLTLLGPQGENVRVAALFNGCAMVAVMCRTIFEKVKHRLEKWKKSERQLRMGNGMIVPSLAVWKGKMRLGNITIAGKFKVFDSGGSWAFLLGYDHSKSIQGKDNIKETLHNQIKKA